MFSIKYIYIYTYTTLGAHGGRGVCHKLWAAKGQGAQQLHRVCGVHHPVLRQWPDVGVDGAWSGAAAQRDCHLRGEKDDQYHRRGEP